MFGTTFPYGTLMVNVAGCFLIAAVMQVALSTELISPTLQLALTTGFLGGLTTYSSFNYEATRLLERAWGPGLLYIALTAAVCFGAGLLGFAAARRLVDLW
jgi:CrcB protein